ncbi:MAG: hypothetical protein O3A51_06615 [Verrucomicrobia bacterium]|nr:hypothetical protein [Verrucomicrobiota bacterium]
MKTPTRCLFWIVGVAAALTLNAANLFWGALNQDEGWYLYGARLVAEGRQPFVDFATTQGPVMTYVYALADPLTRAWGLAGGRLFTSLLGLMGVGLAAWLAGRIVTRDASSSAASSGGAGLAALVTVFLIGVNVFQSYFTTIVKTYALAALLLLTGFALLTQRTGRRGLFCCWVAGFVLFAAAATRLSAVFVLPIVFFVLIRRERAAAWSVFGGAVLACLLLILPFAIRAPEALWFGLVDYHGGRDAGSLSATIAYKAGFVSRLLLAYGAAACVGVAGFIYARLVKPESGSRLPILTMLWWSVAIISAVHLLAPFPYDDYQVMIYPLFAVALAVTLVRWTHQWWISAAVCLICVAMALASPINQSWFVGQRDRIWWPLRAASPLRVLQETAATIRDRPDYTPGATLLTQDPYLAVEAGMRIPRGLELGQFSYFPDWPRERAETCHVLNRDMFRDLLRSCDATLAAFSGYGLAIRSPEVLPLSDAEQAALWALVEARYQPVLEVEPFGQADTRLRLLARRLP